MRLFNETIKERWNFRIKVLHSNAIVLEKHDIVDSIMFLSRAWMSLLTEIHQLRTAIKPGRQSAVWETDLNAETLDSFGTSLKMTLLIWYLLCFLNRIMEGIAYSFDTNTIR